ncbi:MAG: stage III sporulation protein AG [Clostridiales bacterium]|nr:stage III sporulation protein AG [Clostridiales bacterium]
MSNSEERANPGKKKFSFKDINKKDLILLFIAGIVLLLLTVPDLIGKLGTKTKKENVQSTPKLYAAATQNSEDKEYIAYCENKLKKLLEKMEGVGKVEVVVSLKSSKEQVVLKDNPYTQESLSETDNEGGSRISSSTQNQEKTVLVNNKTGETIPYVIKELEPSVEGVVVLAQGGGDGNIATRIVNAVGVLFNVPAHKVQVLEMKE